MTAHPRREKFNRNRDFIIRRPITRDGEVLGSGPLDKTQFSTRRLRLLYDQRFIEAVPDSNSPMQPVNTMPNFYKMNIEQLRDWLTKRGVVPRFNSSQRNLIERAERVFNSAPLQLGADAHGISP